jgi:hypothetical protein
MRASLVLGLSVLDLAVLLVAVLGLLNTFVAEDLLIEALSVSTGFSYAFSTDFSLLLVLVSAGRS